MPLHRVDSSALPWSSESAQSLSLGDDQKKRPRAVPPKTCARPSPSTFGLGSGIWTRDVSKAHRFAKAIRAGSVWINCYQTMDPAVPFGGYKMSGYSRESGIHYLDEFLNIKAVWIKTD